MGGEGIPFVTVVGKVVLVFVARASLVKAVLAVVVAVVIVTVVMLKVVGIAVVVYVVVFVVIGVSVEVSEVPVEMLAEHWEIPGFGCAF